LDIALTQGNFQAKFVHFENRRAFYFRDIANAFATISYGQYAKYRIQDEQKVNEQEPRNDFLADASQGKYLSDALPHKFYRDVANLQTNLQPFFE
jgi:hypothetical protein